MRRVGFLAVLVGLGALLAAPGTPAAWRGASSSGAASGAPSSGGAAPGATAPATLQVILLGTGYPRPDPERAGPATAVAVGGTLYLVDAGRGVVLRLAATEFPLKSIRAVFLTHLHSDP